MNYKKIDLFSDYLDRAALIIYEDLHVDYLTCLIYAGKALLGYENTNLNSDSIIKLNKIIADINQHSFGNEEVRLALQPLIVKGFKHLQIYPLDLMTPDTVVFLFAYLIENIYDKDIKILDIALGTGNLLNGINNFLSHEAELFGIEKEQKLVELAKVSSELQNNSNIIYLNNSLDPIEEIVDVVIGDLDTYYIKDDYFPYLAINKFLNNLNENGMFIYLIDNDFFMKSGNEKFKENFYGTLLGLIVLPDTMFKGTGKSILIGTNKKLEKYEMMVTNMPSFKKQKEVQKTIDNLYIWTQNLKGKIV